MCSQFERQLALFCSPALAGIKPACLMACGHETPIALETYTRAFSPRGIRFQTVFTRDGRCLLMVYNVKLLKKRLSDPFVVSALCGFGYPAGEGCNERVKRLIARLEGRGSFPHEIGLFLGYPVEDVLGFVRNKGSGCKLCGFWKVYGDAEFARREFRRIAGVCRAVTKRVEHGESILEVFAVA